MHIILAVLRVFELFIVKKHILLKNYYLCKKTILLLALSKKLFFWDLLYFGKSSNLETPIFSSHNFARQI